MKSKQPQNSWLKLGTFALVFLGLFMAQGCDSFDDHGGEPEPVFGIDRAPAPTSTRYNKLRHPQLRASAQTQVLGVAGKSSTFDQLFLAFNEYEADGITRRLLNSYEVTARILEEYGITRRVLDQYGITRRVLDQYGITRRILNQYDITRRLLSSFGITPRLLAQYGDQVTAEVLANNSVTEEKLSLAGLSTTDIDEFNRLSAMLKECDVSIETFVRELDAAVQTIRVKVFVEDAHLGVSLEINSAFMDAFLDEISDDPDVLFVEPAMAFNVDELGTTKGSKYDKQIVPWGIERTGTPLPSFWTMLFADYMTGQPVHVYVLDSGVMGNVWLDDLYYVEQKDFTMLFENPDQLTWDEDFAPDVSGFDPGDAGNPIDESGHGTHVAGTIGAKNDMMGIVGVAPHVRIHSLKVLTKEGKTDVTTLMAAVDYVTRAKRENPDRPIVVNMSLGVDIGTTSYNVLDEAIAASIEEGVIYVVSAGNEGQDASTYSPAHVAGAITVGAFTIENELAAFSNYGSGIDVLAPGEGIISLSHELEEVEAAESVLANGTSFAAPYVTGAVARYLGALPNATAEEVEAAIKSTAHPNVTNAFGGTTNKTLHVGDLIDHAAGVRTSDSEASSSSRYSSWGSWGRWSKYGGSDDDDDD